MEINITALFNAQLNDTVCTCNNLPIQTPEHKGALIRYCEADQMNDCSDYAFNNLFAEFVTNEMREYSLEGVGWNWELYETEENSGYIFKGLDGEIYFDLDH